WSYQSLSYRWCVPSPDRHRIHHSSLATGGRRPLSSERVQRGASIVGLGASYCAELVLDNLAHSRKRRDRRKTDGGNFGPIGEPELSKRYQQKERADAASLS